MAAGGGAGAKPVRAAVNEVTGGPILVLDNGAKVQLPGTGIVGGQWNAGSIAAGAAGQTASIACPANSVVLATVTSTNMHVAVQVTGETFVVKVLNQGGSATTALGQWLAVPVPVGVWMGGA